MDTREYQKKWIAEKRSRLNAIHDYREAELYQIEHDRNGLTRLRYAELLQSYEWDDMITVTFRSPRREPYYAAKNVYNELTRVDIVTGFSCEVVRAFIGVEPHQSGDLHIHGLISGAVRGLKPEIRLPWEIFPRLFERFGRTRIEACQSQEKVSLYCAKYVLKEQRRAVDYYYFFWSTDWWYNGKLDADPRGY